MFRNDVDGHVQVRLPFSLPRLHFEEHIPPNPDIKMESGIETCEACITVKLFIREKPASIRPRSPDVNRQDRGCTCCSKLNTMS
jgi:hypothetical protein